MRRRALWCVGVAGALGAAGPALAGPVAPASPHGSAADDADLADPAAHVARLEAALDGARTCREATLHVEQTNRARPMGQTTLRGRVRARLDHSHWSILSTMVDDRGNGRVWIDGGDGSPFLFPIIGKVRGKDGAPLEAGYSQQIVQLLRTEAHAEWLEPRAAGGWTLRRVYRERGGGRGEPRRNELVAHFNGDDVLERIEVHMDLGTRPALLVKLSAMDVDMVLDPEGHVVEEKLRVKARMGAVLGFGIERRLWTSHPTACAEAAL